MGSRRTDAAKVARDLKKLDADVKHEANRSPARAPKSKSRHRNPRRLNVDQTGQLTTNSPLRPPTKSGPQTPAAHKPTAAQKRNTLKSPVESKTIMIKGACATRWEYGESVANILAFCQNLVARMAVDLPHLFMNDGTEMNSRTLLPVDWVLYFATIIIAAYKKSNQLRSAVVGAWAGVPDDAYVPIAVAEYIRRNLHLIGAPEIVRVLELDSDITGNTGQITSMTSPPTPNAASINQNTDPGLSGYEIWYYTSAQASIATMDPNDFSAISFTTNYALFTGSSAWVNTRFTFVLDVMSTLKIGKVRFDSIPRCTSDSSCFGGPISGYTYTTASIFYFPRPAASVELLFVFRPVESGNWFPGLNYQKGNIQPTWAVIGGGTSGNTFPGVPWAGQPVVPKSLTAPSQCVQTANTILMFAAQMENFFFGTKGYKLAGLHFNSLLSIVSVPVDVPSVAQKMRVAWIKAFTASNKLGATLDAGVIQGIDMVIVALIFRKVLNHQVEFISSLGPAVLNTICPFQTFIPSQSYLQSAMLSSWATILDSLGPVGYKGIVRLNSVCTTTAANILVNDTPSNGQKYFFLTKFVGYAPTVPVAANYASGLIVGPTNAAPGDSKTWTFPYFFGGNQPGLPSGSNESVYSAAYSSYSTFPTSLKQSPVEIPTGTSYSQTLALFAEGIVYGANELYLNGTNSYSAAALQGARFTRLNFQFVGARAAMNSLASVISQGTQYINTQLVTCSPYGSVGCSNNFCNLQYNLDLSVNKVTQNINVSIFSGGGISNPVYEVAYAMDYHQITVMQFLVYQNHYKAWVSMLLGTTAYPYSTQSTPTGLGLYTASAYAANSEDNTTFNVWLDWLNEVNHAGSAYNMVLSKYLKRVKGKHVTDGTFEYGRSDEGADTQATTAALIDCSQKSNLPISTTEFKEEEVKMANASAHQGHNNQIHQQSVDLLDSQSAIESTDANFKQIASTAGHYVKAAFPYVIKAAEVAIPALL